MPLMFSTNIVFGRAAITEVEPFTLAFLRWSLSALILMPFVIGTIRKEMDLVRKLGAQFLGLGFLGMWICGAIVYVALKDTSATNGTLIYTTSPVIVILLEYFFRGRKIALREAAGIILAFIGVWIIVFKGSFQNVLNLQFNAGDILFVLTAISWSVYSIFLKSKVFGPLQPFPLFALVAAAGALLLLPFSVYEVVVLDAIPTSARSWTLIAGIVVISSVLAFSAYSFGVHVAGPTTTSIFIYLLPVYGISLAVVLLGETLESFHYVGIVAVLAGVILATLPEGILRRA